MADTNYFAKRVEIIEEYLLDMLKRNSKVYEFPRTDYLLNIIKKSKGNVSVDFLAEESCLSRKQFERNFARFVGVSPKQYLRTIRLQAALHAKGNEPELSIAELSYLCGYFDQAHFTNDFRKITGLSPKQYFDKNDSYSDFFE